MLSVVVLLLVVYQACMNHIHVHWDKTPKTWGQNDSSPSFWTFLVISFVRYQFYGRGGLLQSQDLCLQCRRLLVSPKAERCCVVPWLWCKGGKRNLSTCMHSAGHVVCFLWHGRIQQSDTSMSLRLVTYLKGVIAQKDSELSCLGNNEIYAASWQSFYAVLWYR